MKNVIVRLQQMELINFKNIKKGTITFPSYIKQEYFDKKAEIIGIYGQNGSGKTASIDALWILKNVMLGQRLPQNAQDYILQTAQSSELRFIFYIECEQGKYLVFYEFEISRVEDDNVKITKENLSYKKYVEDSWKSKSGIIDYDVTYQDFVFKPIKNFKMLIADNSNNNIELNVSKKLSEKNINSFIFSSETEEIIKKCNEFHEYTNLIVLLKKYAEFNLYVIKNKHSGLINMNLTIPFSYRLSKETKGDLAIGLSKPSIVTEVEFELVNKLIRQMNIVLETIIPDLNIDIENHGKQLKEDGSNGIRIELVSVKNNLRIPLKYESDGIKKIISVLSTLIATYNDHSICMVVDELDAGIFEYLLGEILQIINQGGKGQLIFTSHNLRPLEMLETNSLIFTTTNPENRYIKFANVKNSNNLRNLYYRSINLGGQKENIYQETNSYEISHAFKFAGGVLDGD